MELAAQPICLPICMNAYFFRGRFVLHLQTGNVNRSAISSGAFAVFPLEIHWIQSWNTPHAFGIPNCVTPPRLRNSSPRNPPSPSEFQDAARGMVWIFSGITQCKYKLKLSLNMYCQWRWRQSTAWKIQTMEQGRGRNGEEEGWWKNLCVSTR